MGKARSNSRTDDQLEAILAERGDWVVNGQRCQALCFASSLGSALNVAAEYTARGAVVSSLSRLPSDNIVVFADQIERLRKIIAGVDFSAASHWMGGQPIQIDNRHQL